ncbi:MAG: sugar-binding domain-containing protein, partial [Armatimonadota bacterium]
MSRSQRRALSAIAAWLVAYLAMGTVLAGPLVLTEQWGNLEGPWLFRTDPLEVGEKEGWEKPGLDESGWRTLTVPGSWEPQGVTDPRPGQPPKKPAAGVRWSDYDGTAWYRLHFIAPKHWANDELVLRLGSVDDYDRAFLNGRLVGQTGVEVERAVSVQRVYAVPPGAVRFGRETVLAIRVVDGGGPGGLMGPAISLLPKRIAEAPMKLPQADRPLRERFDDPPAASRFLKIIHSWPDEPEAQDSLIRSLIYQGFGGVVCNVSFTDYLESEQKWRAFVRAVREARKAGMSLWLYDERGYPSGAAGGITLRDHPEWEARGLLIAEADCDERPVALHLPPGQPVMAAAYPRTDDGIDVARSVDLAEQVRDGRLSWTPPPGRWRVMAVTEDRLYDGTHASLSLGDKLPYINLLMPEPTARFIDVTHQAYAEHLGDHLGEWFVSTFTD